MCYFALTSKPGQAAKLKVILRQLDVNWEKAVLLSGSEEETLTEVVTMRQGDVLKRKSTNFVDENGIPPSSSSVKNKKLSASDGSSELVSWVSSHHPKGGAEHFPFWFQALTEAKTNPAELKEHVMRRDVQICLFFRKSGCFI